MAPAEPGAERLLFAMAEEATPSVSETHLGMLVSDGAEQAGSRQALLSTALGTEVTQQPDGFQPSVDEQPWMGASSVAGVSPCACMDSPPAGCSVSQLR